MVELLEQAELGWPKRKKKRGAARGLLEDVSVDDTARQPPSPDLYWDLGCVSKRSLVSASYRKVEHRVMLVISPLFCARMLDTDLCAVAHHQS